MRNQLAKKIEILLKDHAKRNYNNDFVGPDAYCMEKAMKELLDENAELKDIQTPNSEMYSGCYKRSAESLHDEIMNDLVAKAGVVVLPSYYEGFGFGFRGYELDSQIWKPLFVKLQSGGVVTSVALEKMKFLRAVPMQDGDVAYSAADQRNVAVAFNCYLDETTLINSVPQLFTVGDVTP